MNIIPIVSINLFDDDLVRDVIHFLEICDVFFLNLSASSFNELKIYNTNGRMQ